MIATLGEMLDKAQDYAESMSVFFADFRDRALDGEARLLTYHIARQKRSLQRLKTVFSTEELTQARTFPLTIKGADFAPERVFDSAFLASKAKPAEVIGTALEFMEVIACLYAWLGEQFTTGPAAAVIQELIINEKQAIADLQTVKAKHF